VLIIGTHAEDERCTDEYLTQTHNQYETPLCSCYESGQATPTDTRHSRHDTYETRDRLARRYGERFPNVLGIHFVSCTTGKGLDQLLANLQSIIAKQEHVGQAVPSNYLELEKVLASQAKERVPPIVAWSEYRTLARLCLIEHEHDLLTATSLLHNFGSLVHFPNDDKVPHDLPHRTRTPPHTHTHSLF
jgi:hypothetical protein